jgi:hypothetical protein
MTETAILKEIQLAVSKIGARVFRNNCGYLQDKRRQWVKFGIANPGGSDLIGYTKEGRFLAIEVKTPTGTVTDEQMAFINAVNKSGGLAFVARSASEAISKISLTND